MEEIPSRESIIENLKTRWVSLFTESDSSLVSDIFDELYENYDDLKRSYHNMVHIDKLLRLLDGCNFVQKKQKKLLEIAIWFHDVIYLPESDIDNELESAKFAELKMNKLYLLEDDINEVKKLILITKHSGLPKTEAEKIMVDLDLSILGSDNEEYNKYATSIRDEYKFVPEADYKTGRRNVLESFLSRDYIFSTEFFRDRFELKARANINREINSLTA